MVSLGNALSESVLFSFMQNLILYANLYRFNVKIGPGHRAPLLVKKRCTIRNYSVSVFGFCYQGTISESEDDLHSGHNNRSNRLKALTSVR